MLTERILTIETAEGKLAANLPEALARLCDQTLLGFDGLAAHQRHPWDLFLSQTAAMALVRTGKAADVDDEESWRRLADPDGWRDRLMALTPENPGAWSLVVDDLTQPAFMQPPIEAGSLAGYTIAGQTPDEIDVLVTSKGHDVKAARAGAAQPRDWLFALCTLQTLQGYSGRGNFGIARMNGGFASRPMVMLTPSRDLPTRFRRGVQAALAARAEALRLQGGYYQEDGLPLLWLTRWDPEDRLYLDDLDPLFVEICRRIRLARNAAGQIVAWGRPSERARVDVPKESKGHLSDAWTPISAKDGAALNVQASGFDYRLVRKLIATQEFKRPAAMVPQPADRGALWLHAAVLVRGQGKTEGFHERWLLIPTKARSMVATVTIDRLSKGMIEDADAAKKALWRGLQSFLQGGAEKIDFKDNRPQPWSDTLDQEIDRIFFDHLFNRAAAADEDAEDGISAQAWREELCGITQNVFDKATDRLDPPQSRRERARAIASRTFDAMLWKARLIRRAAADGDTAEENQL